MPRMPDDMSAAAIRKRLAMTEAMKAAQPKEPATPPPPKIRIAKGR